MKCVCALVFDRGADAQSMTEGHKIGVTGFCMGGMYALMAGCTCTGLSASVPFYGLLSHRHGILHSDAGLDPALKPREPLDAVRDLRSPTLAFFGDHDQFIPVSDIELLKERFAEISHFSPWWATRKPASGRYAWLNPAATVSTPDGP